MVRQCADATPERLVLTASDDRPLAVHFVPFVPGEFSDALFALSGIPLPKDVAQSVPKRRQEFFHGRLAAKHALAALFGSTEPAHGDVAIGSDREPVWPSGIVGSISHCADLAAAAVDNRSRRRGLGIDVEHVIGPETRSAMLETAVCREEAALLQRMRLPWSYDASLTMVFSAKESLYKGLFGTVGCYFGFEEATVRSVDPEKRRLRFALSEMLRGSLAGLRYVDAGYTWLSDKKVLTNFAW